MMHTSGSHLIVHSPHTQTQTVVTCTTHVPHLYVFTIHFYYSSHLGYNYSLSSSTIIIVIITMT